MMRRDLLALAVAACALGATFAPCAAGTPEGVPVEVHASAREIEVTPRYSGELIRVWGSVPEDCYVVVKLSSPREPAVFSRKGKVGPFWLSVGRVRFKNVPWMYKVKSDLPIDEILTRREELRYQLGIRGLKASIDVQKGVDRDLYLNELIMTRKAGRLFSFGLTGVTRRGPAFTTSFFWPSDGPPGRYRIEAFAAREGLVVGSGSVGIEVKRVGLEAWVSRLSRHHGMLYGAFAVALAVVAGLAASLVFRRPKRVSARPA